MTDPTLTALRDMAESGDTDAATATIFRDAVTLIERLEKIAIREADEELRETIDEAGFWHSCSGCRETFEGRSCGHYPVHPLFNCEMGAGCGECGGIGVLWDDIDYSIPAR